MTDHDHTHHTDPAVTITDGGGGRVPPHDPPHQQTFLFACPTCGTRGLHPAGLPGGRRSARTRPPHTPPRHPTTTHRPRRPHGHP